MLPNLSGLSLGTPATAAADELVQTKDLREMITAALVDSARVGGGFPMLCKRLREWCITARGVCSEDDWRQGLLAMGLNMDTAVRQGFATVDAVRYDGSVRMATYKDAFVAVCQLGGEAYAATDFGGFDGDDEEKFHHDADTFRLLSSIAVRYSTMETPTSPTPLLEWIDSRLAEEYFEGRFPMRYQGVYAFSYKYPAYALVEAAIPLAINVAVLEFTLNRLMQRTDQQSWAGAVEYYTPKRALKRFFFIQFQERLSTLTPDVVPDTGLPQREMGMHPDATTRSAEATRFLKALLRAHPFTFWYTKMGRKDMMLQTGPQGYQYPRMILNTLEYDAELLFMASEDLARESEQRASIWRAAKDAERAYQIFQDENNMETFYRYWMLRIEMLRAIDAPPDPQSPDEAWRALRAQTLEESGG